MNGKFSPPASLPMAISLGLLCTAALAMSMARVAYTGERTWSFLMWNLFLAWVPLGAAVLFRFLSPKGALTFFRGLLLGILGLVWFLFFPNAPYMVTDFIHINGREFFALTQGQWVFNREFLLWYDLVMMTLFVMTALMTGFWSLFLMQKSVKENFGRPLSWLFSGFVLFIASFGIYLGRFIRWNSWDLVTNPKDLIKSVLGNFHDEALGFTLLFFAFLVLLYINFYYWSFLSVRESEGSHKRKEE